MLPLSRCQISLESLILWLALAGMLAAFTPLVGNVLHAYALQTQAQELAAFSARVQQSLNELSFSGEGTQYLLHMPAFENVKMESSEHVVHFVMEDASLPVPKTFSIESPLPLSVNGVLEEGKWIIRRRADGLEIEWK